MALQNLLQLDRARSQPLYRQIADQIRGQINDGRLPIGTRLPTVRQLARTLGVTRLTVHSAYSELQSGGWVEATVGRGTFVAASVQPPPLNTTNGSPMTADGVLDDLLRIAQMVGLHSMGYAEPDVVLYPAREFWESVSGLHNDVSILHYGSTQGDPMLRVELATLLAEQGIEVVPDEILITQGVSQGLSLTTQALAHPGDTVAVEQPTYLGLLNILKAQGITPVGVPQDSEGPSIEALERVIAQHHPRFFYTIPRFHNPTGICMSPQRQGDLLSLAERSHLTLVEDDIYGLLSYDHADKPPMPLKALDRHGLVVYLQSVSKVMLPGIRVGYMVAPESLHERLLTLRRANDLTGASLLQRAVADFLHRGRLRQHLRRVVPVYRERRDTLLTALSGWMPSYVQWTRPAGGFCCWVTIPDDPALDDLYSSALSRGFAFTPGEVFLAEPDGRRHFRLCFGSLPSELIRDGVAILGDLLRERIGFGARRITRPSDWVPLV